ncbi:MAG: hypothetical protein NZM26_05530 [Patescibacteria group bacterium]|nr:hypothetical protein [Patescibacteria group bacterium]
MVRLILFSLAIAFTQNKDVLPVRQVILLVKPDKHYKQLDFAKELISKNIPTFIQFKYNQLDDVEKAINFMLADALSTETLLKVFFASVLLQNGDTLSDEDNKKIDEIRNQTIESILTQDPSYAFVTKLFSSFGFNTKDPRFDFVKDYPSWIIYINRPSSDKPEMIILEGFEDNILKFIDTEKKVLKFEELKNTLDSDQNNANNFSRM